MLHFWRRKRAKIICQNIEFRQSQNKAIEIRSVCAGTLLNWRHRARNRYRRKTNNQNDDWRRMFIYGKLFRAHFSLDARVQFHFLWNALIHTQLLWFNVIRVFNRAQFSLTQNYRLNNWWSSAHSLTSHAHQTHSKHSIDESRHMWLCSGCFFVLK